MHDESDSSSATQQTEKKHSEHATHHKSSAEPKQTQNDVISVQISKSTMVTVVTTVIATLAVVLFAWIVFDAFFAGGSVTSGSGAGVQDGILTIYKYSDFECIFCARALPTMEQVRAEFGDSVVIEYRQFPLPNNRFSQKAAEASECARDQGLFWEYHDVLFANRERLDVNSLKQYAEQVGLDMVQFNTCLDTSAKAGVVAEHIAEARAKGVSATPTFDIGGEIVRGAVPFSDMRRVIEAQLSAAGNTVSTSPTPSVPSNDPIVELTVIVDESCIVCEHEPIIEVTQTELFPTTQVQIVSINSPIAQQLIAQYDIQSVPAYIFDSAVAQTQNFPQVSGAFIQSGNSFIIDPAATGLAFRLLGEIDIEGRPSIGSENAPVTIVEFSDFTCPFCSRFFTETYGQIKSAYIDTGLVRFVYVPWIRGAASEPSSLAAYCAFDQGDDLFWAYHDYLRTNSQVVNSVATLKEAAVAVGLSSQEFNTCMDNRVHQSRIEADRDFGLALGVSGTPGFFINGINVAGAYPFEYFQTIIDSLLEN